jgi:hypothetical protein
MGQHGDPILPPFAVAHGDLLIGKVDIFDLQAHAFHETEPGAIEQTRYEGGHVVELGEHCVRFLTGEDRGESLRALSAFNIVQVWKRLFEDVPVQKQEGIQGPVLGSRRHSHMATFADANPTVARVGQIRGHGIGPH